MEKAIIEALKNTVIEAIKEDLEHNNSEIYFDTEIIEFHGIRIGSLNTARAVLEAMGKTEEEITGMILAWATEAKK